MTTYTRDEILKRVTDELRAVNKALKVGGNLALTETDFQYIGTIMCALKEDEPVGRVYEDKGYDVTQLFI